MDDLSYLLLIGLAVMIVYILVRKVIKNKLARTIVRISLKTMIVLIIINLISSLISGSIADWYDKPAEYLPNLLSIKWLHDKLSSIAGFFTYIFGI